ncbi:MAG: polyphenol oxidase family protein [Candidatus Roizmanbacteria bacterium]|nr:polyphenol oxidase family protein [Candidatus Roizmanbacteria bacterium]
MNTKLSIKRFQKIRTLFHLLVMLYNPSKEINSELIKPIHGVTTRFDGSFQSRESIVNYLSHRIPNIDTHAIFGIHQIHSSDVHVLRATDKPDYIDSLDVDGLILKKGNALSSIYVKVADCIPLILWDAETFTCAVVHSGWKGTYENISRRTIETMVKLGSKPASIYAFIGPYIHDCCYQVDDVRARLFKSSYIRSVDGRLYLSIGTVVEDQLIYLGVPKKNIDHSPLCTSCDARFFSYWRENTHTHGTMVAYIAV